MRRFRATTFLAAVASLGAGGVHLATGGPHLQESVPLGAALVTVGWIQLILGALVWGRPHRVTAIALTVVHVASIAAWSVSRSIGLPFGHPGGEPFGVAGLTVVGLELVALAALAVFLRDPARVRRLTAGVAFGALVIVLGGASVAVANVGTGHEPGGDGTAEDHDDGHEETGGGHEETGGDEESGGGHEESGDGHGESGDGHQESGEGHDDGGDGASRDGSATTSERTDADAERGQTSGDHSDDGHDDGHDGGH